MFVDQTGFGLEQKTQKEEDLQTGEKLSSNLINCVGFERLRRVFRADSKNQHMAEPRPLAPPFPGINKLKAAAPDRPFMAPKTNINA